MTHPATPHHCDDHPRREPDTLRVENAALRKGFTLLPNAVLRARKLSRDAKLLYGILLSYAWQTDSCFPGYETLMEDMQCAREALAKYIRELKDLGLIAVQRRGQGKTSVYTIKDLAGQEIQQFDNRTSRSSESEPPVVRKANGEEYPEKENSEEEHSNIRSATPKKEEPNVATRALVQPAHTTSHGIEPLGTVLFRRRGKPPAEEREAKLAVESALREIAAEFGDRASLASSTARALNLMRQANLIPPAFVATLYEARSITKDRLRSGGPVRNAMGFFFAVLEDRLGLRDQTNEPNELPGAG